LLDQTKWQSEFLIFDDLAAFSGAVDAETGEAIDLESVAHLHTDFIEATDRFLLLNIKEYSVEEPNNLLLLTEGKAFVFSKSPPQLQEAAEFADILQKPFGRSTVLCFLTLDKVLINHTAQLEMLVSRTARLEESFDHAEYRELALEFERLDDRLEEFHKLVLRLQERRYKQVETQQISFDYNVLIGESASLEARCQRRISVLKDLRQDHEIMATEELNKRIIGLNDVVKRLTAITVILMLPTLIASHFGMNFAHMPELKIAWVYPVVIGAQFAIVGAGIAIFRKIGWL
jgi:hypothetical protein